MLGNTKVRVRNGSIVAILLVLIIAVVLYSFRQAAWRAEQIAIYDQEIKELTRILEALPLPAGCTKGRPVVDEILESRISVQAAILSCELGAIDHGQWQRLFNPIGWSGPHGGGETGAANFWSGDFAIFIPPGNSHISVWLLLR